jgi:hypothetical protein
VAEEFLLEGFVACLREMVRSPYWKNGKVGMRFIIAVHVAAGFTKRVRNLELEMTFGWSILERGVTVLWRIQAGRAQTKVRSSIVRVISIVRSSRYFGHP